MAIKVTSGESVSGKIAATMARIVLDDCRTALRELQAEPTTDVWRIRWVAILALLRTVREVLTKVDGASPYIHPELHNELLKFPKRMKETKPDPKIYWGFICDDANNILHEYKFSALQEVTFREKRGQKPDIVTTSTGMCHLPEGEWDIERTYLMKTGPFADRDQRDVVQEAIAWWQEQIEEMENRAAASVVKERL